MKSTFLKKTVLMVVIACAMAVLMAFEAPVRVFAASAPIYASEVQIVEATSKADAESKMTNGFTLISQPLYENEKTGTKTYLTYKRTYDKNDAIVDLKAMNMNGGYSYALYEDYLEQQQLVATTLVEDLVHAINEVKGNLKLKTVPETALYAQAVLAYFVEDDTGLTLDKLFFGDLEKDLKMTEKEWKEHLVTMFMQSNTEILAAVERLLLIGCSESTSFSFLQKLDNDAKNGITGVPEEVKTSLNDKVVDYLVTLEDLQNAIRFFQNCQKQFEYTDEMDQLHKEQKARAEEMRENGETGDLASITAGIRAAEADDSPLALSVYQFYDTYYNKLTSLQQSYWQTGHVLADELTKYQYPSERFATVYDLVLGIDPDTEREEDYNEIYPLLNAMTAGQRGMMKVGMDNVFLSILVDKSIYMAELAELRGDYVVDEEEYNERLESGEFIPDAEDFSLSVYYMVDRSLYTPDGIAMTSEALARNNTVGGEPFGQLQEQPHINEKYSGKLMTILTSITGVLSGLLFVSMTAMWISMTVASGEFGWSVLCTIFAFMGAGFVAEGISTLLATAATALFWLTIAMVCVTVIIAVKRSHAQEADANYVPIPRVLCSEEELLPTGKLDAEGNEIKDKGYVYYYGVKNPTLANREEGKDYSGGSGVMDIYNWELGGASRQWVALYATKDPRKGTPIDFGQIKISETGSEQGYATMQLFSTENCDLAEYNRLTHDSDSSIKPKYLHYVITEPDVAGSVFAEGKTWAFGGIGLVIGALGGIALSTFARKSKKEGPAEA